MLAAPGRRDLRASGEGEPVGMWALGLAAGWLPFVQGQVAARSSVSTSLKKWVFSFQF